MEGCVRMLVLAQDQVESLLDLDQLAEAVGAALADLTAGRASVPSRGAAVVPERHGMLLAMSAFVPSSGALTTKLVSLFPLNTERPTHQALICCFDTATGTPLAVMDGTYITAVRTAAASVLATRHMARRDVHRLCVIGTGVQARAHVIMFSREPGIGSICVAGRSETKVAHVVEEFKAQGLAIEAAASIEEAVRTADVVCATTHAERPVLRREWLRPGVHINSVGYNTAGDGEIDTDTVRDSVLVVESRDAALAPPPAGAIELRRAIERGAITPDHVHAELGELVRGTVIGRTDDGQITLYKAVGVAVEDAAAAALVLARAREGTASRA